MKSARIRLAAEREHHLQALKVAIVHGATSRYDRLVADATAAGATDDEIDAVASEAIQSLLTGAEQPVTTRDLAYSRSERLVSR